MRVLRIKLISFGEYQDRVVADLTGPLNLVLGPNESGKSTLLGALRFAWDGKASPDYKSDRYDRQVELLLEKDQQRWR